MRQRNISKLASYSSMPCGFSFMKRVCSVGSSIWISSSMHVLVYFIDIFASSLLVLLFLTNNPLLITRGLSGLCPFYLFEAISLLHLLSLMTWTFFGDLLFCCSYVPYLHALFLLWFVSLFLRRSYPFLPNIGMSCSGCSSIV